jgi:DNA-binding beta-propeller fold protein YncE
VRRAAVALVALLAACSSGDPTSAPAPSRPRVEISPLEGRPSALVVSGGTVWIADDQRGVVVRLDAGNGRQLGAPIAVSPHPIAIDADDTSVWVGDRDGHLTRIDKATNTPNAVLPLGGQLTDVLVADGWVWVADIESGNIRLVDAATATTGRRIGVPAGAVRLARGQGRVWVSNLDHTVSSIEFGTFNVSEPLTVGNGPVGLATSEGAVWVGNSDDGTVSRVRASDGQPDGAPIKVGSGPVAVAVSGADLWVVNHDSRTASRVALDNAAVLDAAIDLGTTPRDVDAVEGGVWVVGVEPSAAVLVRRRGA